jgi:hypothetical protein
MLEPQVFRRTVVPNNESKNKEVRLMLNATFRKTLKHTVAATTGLLILVSVSTRAEVTMETLLDRIQIEDMLVRYYYDLAQGNAHEMSEFFTEDALLDVDGTIANGREAIEALYNPSGEKREKPATPRPQNHMLLTNPVIDIHGDTAEAHVVWTGIKNNGVGEEPSLYEQGREDTALVKVNGKWLISKRYISSDSGTPDRFDATYEPRGNMLAE